MLNKTPTTLILWSTSSRYKRRKPWFKQKAEDHLPPIAAKSPHSRTTTDLNTKSKVPPAKLTRKFQTHPKVVLINPLATKEVNLSASKWKLAHHPLKSVDKTKIEDILAKAPARDKTTLKELSDFFKKFPLTAAEKAFLLYRWHALNIAYNMEGYLSGNCGDNSPDAVLKAGKSVCAGYAGLFNALATQIGLKTEVVTGNGKTGLEEKFASDHAWIAAEIEGNWYLIDPTWGAGSGIENVWNKEYKEYFFCPNPAEFIRSHFPDNPKWQLLDKPITKILYRGLAFLRYEFFEHGLKKVIPDASVIKVQDIAQLVIEFPASVKPKFIAKLNERSPDNGKLVEVASGTSVTVENNKAIIKTTSLKPGVFILMIYCNLTESSTYNYVAQFMIKSGVNEEPVIENKPIKGLRIKVHNPEKGPELISPIGDIEKNEKTEFKVKVPKAKKVAVFVGKKLYQLIPKEGDIFESKVVVAEAGPVIVKAQVNGKTEYKELFKLRAKQLLSFRKMIFTNAQRIYEQVAR
eukprot:TRINITY_DN136415_c0_g1_i1.p1 TRINITY_DN136415_c0_g1~~TRINITY_DN136415_c0_g1_i1.p1  ORF type:complete len:553 (+),score=49.44 TRINITY_DN136415_c0_g1_i1:105-1661(+)